MLVLLFFLLVWLKIDRDERALNKNVRMGKEFNIIYKKVKTKYKNKYKLM